MASKRRIRRKMCDGKFRHTEIKTANGHAYKLHMLAGDAMHFYKCPFCKGLHVGHA